MRVLLIEDDDAMRLSLVQTLELEDYVVVSANGYEQARRAIRANFPGVILTDIRMPRYDGFHVLERAQAVDPDLPVIFLTGEADVPMAVDALKNGVFDFLEKPCSMDQLLKVIAQATKQREATLRSRKLQRKLEQGDLVAQHFPGVSNASKQIRTELRALQTSRKNLHIWGEKGAGRKLSVECIAQAQPDLRNIYLQCGPEASNWPEIEDLKTNIFVFGLSIATKAQLNEISKLTKSTAPIRLITVDRHNLATLKRNRMEAAFFNDYLPYELKIPSLNDRRIDVAIIFENYLQKAARDLGLSSRQVDQSFLDELKTRDWPQNLYSLEEAARSHILGTKSNAINNYSFLIDQFEKTLLTRALQENNGNVSRVAEEINMPKKTLYDKLTKHSLSAKDYRN